jgi:tetratricopeptide (TPR) repeat protein
MVLSLSSLFLLLMVALPGMVRAQAGASGEVREPRSLQTLCILDFSRLGDDPSMDWLERGLADMIIGVMNRLGPYQVVERKHLRHRLREQGLTASGVIDIPTAVRQARLAKAELLLLGSFVPEGERLAIQVRLVRVVDQQVLAYAIWKDRHVNVLAAPQALSEKLLANLKQPVDPRQLEGIEKEIPRTVDVAKAYYAGMGAFDNGRYLEALAHYLDAVRQAGDFVKVYPAVLEMYSLLGQGEHAVLFARKLARSYEETGDVPSALEYYFAAAQQSLDALDNQQWAAELLEKLLRLVARHEQKTAEITRTKRLIRDQIVELHGTGKYDSFGKILAERSIRYRVWPGDIEAELTRRAEEQARGGFAVFQDGQWIKRLVPKPSVLMWKIRAQRTLARAYARLGEIERALDYYQELLAEHDFVARYPLSDGTLLDPVRTEAHFMMLYHYAKTGQLIRKHPLNKTNRLNLVRDGLVFKRDFGDFPPDPRARVASRYEGRGYEYFDFAAPPGYQIDAVTLRAQIEGIAAFGFNLPHTVGWPPRFSFSKRLTQLKFSKRGSYDRTIALPRGTEFVSISTSWGPGLFENTPAEVLRYRQFAPKNGPDIVSWQATFAVSRKQTAIVKGGSGVAAPPGAPVQKLISRYAAGWKQAFVVRSPQAILYKGNPSLDVYAEDWLVYSLDGDIRIFYRSNPKLTIPIPITINTREPEFDPSLVRTHDGRYALLWARGTSKRNARRFVAFSADLLRWETPRRMVFEEPGQIGYTYARAEPLERTTNVVPIRQGYSMLLAQGFMRYSEDLRNWGAPRKVIPQDLYRNTLVKTPDGTLWAVYERSSEELQPYTPEDWLHGYFVVDRKQYRHVTGLQVSRSMDGVHWQEAGKIVFPGQPSGLWAFPVAERQIGIAVAFNNLYAKWLTASFLRDLSQVDSELPLMHHAEETECFVHDRSVVCIRPVFDADAQRQMLLATSSDALYKELTE